MRNRNTDIISAAKQGISYNVIAEAHGITRERVRQIVGSTVGRKRAKAGAYSKPVQRRRWQMEARLCRDWVQKYHADVFAKISKVAQRYAVNGGAS